MAEEKYTPMMQQYLNVKNKHLDCIMFYRLGDFYEMFFEDAKIASSELDLVLTGRNAGVSEKVPMCGIPYHAATGYIQRLIQKGYKVAIVEQLENPADAVGIVKRDVIKIVTPGTIMEELNDDLSTVNIAGICDFQYGLSILLCEMTTGDMQAINVDHNYLALQKVLLSNNVKEIVVNKNFDKKLLKVIQDNQTITISFEDNNNKDENYNHLLANIEDPNIIKAFILLTNYLNETQKRSMSHLNPVVEIHENEFLQMDYSTRTNLELTTALRNNSKSTTLWSFLDKCCSAMGSRLLKKWIEYPLVEEVVINKRQDAIEFLNENFIMKDELKDNLKQVYDLQRLCARIAYGNANPRDLLRLSKTLESAPKILEIFSQCKAYPELSKLDDCAEITMLLKNAFVELPPISIKEGGIFVDGYNEQLDELRRIGKTGQDYIIELENQERERTGIKSLKIGYNRIFGYYIEVTKGSLNLVKEEFGYIRKQTLTNCERYITPQLKEKEDAILHAQEKSIRIETELFIDLVNKISVYLPKLHDLAQGLAVIDALYSLAVISSNVGYVRPTFHSQHSIEVIEGRHPILEKIMKNSTYVPNSLIMEEGNAIEIVTGPNMGGKSTYMRQAAVIVLLAQIGCYIPAKSAELPIFDKIFTRIGASDDIMSGQSTFMVEMIEANNALKNATENSLILFDEIGRGTSTYDGMALAHAILEYISSNIKAKTLFSTHYHELTGLECSHKDIKNKHVEVYEENDHVTFLYKITDGKADKSYGINVARLAKLPESLLVRAKQILDSLEQDPNTNIQQSSMLIVEQSNPKHEHIIEQLNSINPNAMTPLDALRFITELKNNLE
ncbi:MAG: DNA mismatch repair protein MutS [Erysipelotrichaceae bacterium]